MGLKTETPKRSGKTLDWCKAELWENSLVEPPATREEALAFCRLQIKRCNVNLANAKDRGDKRAIINLERKLAVYQFLYRTVESIPAVTECPKCRVYAVENGVCACCGYSEETVTTSD